MSNPNANRDILVNATQLPNENFRSAMFSIYATSIDKPTSKPAIYNRYLIKN